MKGSSREMGSIPESERSLEIKDVKVVRELPELSGKSIESSNGSIDDTRGVIIEVKTNKGVYEVVALFADHVEADHKNSDDEKATSVSAWKLTSIRQTDASAMKHINISGKYGATFEVEELTGEEEEQILERIRKSCISETGELNFGKKS